MLKLQPYLVRYFDLQKDAWYIMDFVHESSAKDFMSHIEKDKRFVQITLEEGNQNGYYTGI